MRRIDFILQPPQAPPEQWSPYGNYLWWWVPPSTLGKTSINVLDVSMSRTSTSPYTFTAPPVTGTGLQPALTTLSSLVENPSRFFFSTLWFGNDGYLIQFSAKDLDLGLEVKPTDNGFTKSKMVVYGLNYYQNTMGTATPSRPSGFNKVTPANVATIPAISPTLSWGNSPGASRYEYCYDKTNNTTCDGNWTIAGDSTSVILSGLDKGSTYYWQVRALNDFGTIDADEGKWWGFTTSLYYYLYLPMTLR